MPVLDNAKHEAFARAIVAGRCGRDAYRGAGFKPSNDNTADACASRLLATAKVAARVAELKSEVAAQVVSARVMDLNEVLEEFSKLGRANMRDFVALGIARPEVGLSRLTPEQAAAISSLTFEETVVGKGKNKRLVPRVKKFTLHSKGGALSELLRHHEPQRHELSGPGGKPIETKDASEPLGDLELARRLAFVLELGARASSTARSRRPPTRDRAAEGDCGK